MSFRLFTLCLLLAGLSLPCFGASVSGNNQPITSGDTTPDVADGTDFGRVFIGTEVAREFTHRNNSGVIENPNSVSITSGDTADFTARALYPGVEVRFRPRSAGYKTAVISVGVTNPITFTVAGRCEIDAAVWTETFDAFGLIPPGWESSSGWFSTNNPLGFSGRGMIAGSSYAAGTGTLVSPPIAVQQNSLLRFSHIARLYQENASSLAVLEYQQSGETVWNPLPLSAIRGGDTWSGTTMFQPQTVNIDLGFAAGQTISVRWRFTSSTSFSFTNNYWFIDGVSLHELSEADFTVEGNNEVIRSGDTTPRTADDTDFGTKSISSTTTHTFTVNYFSSVVPSFRGTPTVSITGPDAASFSVVGNEVLSASGSTATFQIAFSPTSLGRKNATISIAKSATGPAHFTCSISGTAAEVVTFFNETFSDETDGFDVTGWTPSVAQHGWQWNEDPVTSVVGTQISMPAGVFYTAQSDELPVAGSLLTLGSPLIQVRHGSVLSFEHNYLFGSSSQGVSSGALDYSLDGGTTWLPVPESAIEGGYRDGFIDSPFSLNPLNGRPVWWGFRGVGALPETVRVHLDEFASQQSVRIRWVQGNGFLPVYRVWWIDNVKVTAPLPTLFDVTGNDVVIESGDDTPSAADNTDFGLLQGSNGGFTPRTRSFSIASIPALPTPPALPADFEITMSGPDAADFRIEGLATAGDPRTFSVVFDPKSMGNKSAVVNVSGGGTSHSFGVAGVAEMLTGPGFLETFEGSPFDNNGWVIIRPFFSSNGWLHTEVKSRSASHSMFVDSAISSNDTQLISPEFAVTSGTKLRFYHIFTGTQTIALRYSTSGNNHFNPSNIPTSAITGFPASPSTMQLVEVDLGSFAAGQRVKIYWTSSQPSATPYQQVPRGWYIDDVSVQDIDDGGADLSNLVVNTTPITPVFATLTTTYTGAVVPNATTSVTVRPTVKMPGSSLQVRVNGGSFSSVASGLNSVALALNSAANNVIEVKVTAQDGIRTKTYTVNLFRDGLPIIRVTGGSNTDIVSQDFGLLSLFKQTTRSFTIFNTGDGTLNVSQLQILGQTSDFALSTNTPTAIAPNSSAGFSVTFSPQALGSRSGTVRVISNAQNFPTYQFSLAGQGGQPEIGISWRNVNLPDGTTVATREQGTDYGIIGTTSSTVRTFTITNTGNTSLLFTGSPKIQIAGSTAFYYVNMPPDSIAPGGTGSFSIGFTPSGTADYTATIRLLNDDLDEGDYTFVVSGRGAGPTPIWTDYFDAPGGTDVAGWTHYAINGTQDWTHFRGGGSTTYWKNPSSGDWGDRALVTPPITVLPGTRLAFLHQYNLDSTYCGVVLEYSSDGGSSWLPVPETSMKNAGYDKALAYGSVLEGKRGWTGTTGNNVPAEEVDLGSFANGKTIHVRWHAADNHYRNVTGFYHVDNVSLYNLNFGNVADLASLVITTNTPTQPPPNTSLVVLDRPFNNLITGYSGTVTSSPTIRLNAKLADITASMTASINGGASFDLVSGVTSAAKLINPGYNYVNVVVTTPVSTSKVYNVTVYRATAPDILISGASVPIASGDTTPSADDHTDFGPTPLNTQVTRTFTIRNNGGGPLNLGGIQPVRLSSGTAFTVTAQPVTSLMEGGTESEFTICFTPTSNGPTAQATVTINSDDHDEGSYTFTLGGFGGIPSSNADLSNIAVGSGTLSPSFTAASISYLATSSATSSVITATPAHPNATVEIRPGQGAAAPSGTSFSLGNGSNYYEIVVTAEDRVTKRSYYVNVMLVPPPEINVSANGQNIVSGDTTPSLADFTDFGNTVVNGSTSRAFRINNNGAGPLLINDVTITGSTDFSLTVPPIANISSNGQTSLTLRFLPTGLGQKNTSVTITNNDSDEGTYTFSISGNGYIPSSNADLAGLSLRGFTMASAFSATTASYAATLPSAASSVTVDAQPADSGASVIVRMAGALDRASGVPVDVNFGANRFDVIVTAADAIATRTYTLIVTRNGPPEIAVNGNDQLIPSNDTTPSAADFTDFGDVTVNAGDVIRSFSIANTGAGPLALGTVTVTGSSDFVLTTPPASTVGAGGSSSLQIRFDPTDVGLKTAVVTIPNDDSDEAPYSFTINGRGTVVVPTAPDIAVRFNSGDILQGNLIPIDFGSVNASSGSISRTFSIANTGTAILNLTGTPRVAVTGANAGDFVVSAPPITGTIGVGAQTSFIVTFDPSSTGAKTATIVIPNDDPNEAPFTFAISGIGIAPSVSPPTVTKSASATSYTVDVVADGSWSVFEGLTWASVSAASGSGNASLTVSLLANTTSTARTGTITIAGATHTITQNGIEVPTLDPLNPSYDTTVGLPFSLAIIAQGPPFTLTASGLPTGLRMGNDGLISGQATLPGSYNVTVRATNVAGTASATFTIVVAPFPASFVGSWAGLVQRIPTGQLGATGDLGARFEMTSTVTGAITGRLTEGGTAHGFTGQLALVDTDTASLSVLIPGTSATLNLTVDTNDLAVGTLDTSTASAAVEAWRRVWTVGSPASLYAARHNFALANNSGQGPEGFSYGSFMVTANTGALVVSGKLAEGTALTSSTFMGPSGEVLIYQSLYVNKGTVHGKLSVDANAAPVDDNTISGTLTWSRPATNTTLYRDGFGPIDLEASGGTYIRPAPGQRVLDLPAVVAPNTNARLAFDLGGMPPFEQALRISSPTATSLTNTVSIATRNPNAVSITSLNPATGLFAGRFRLRGPTAALNRTVSFTGQITQTPSGPAGLGYFILPQLPIAPETLATSPRLSGSVTLEP